MHPLPPPREGQLVGASVGIEGCDLTSAQTVAWILPQETTDEVLGLWRERLVLTGPYYFIWNTTHLVCPDLQPGNHRVQG